MLHRTGLDGKLAMPLDILEILPYNALMSPGSLLLREDAVRFLRRHGIGPTRQRIDIAQILFAEHQHLSADQIQSRIDARHAHASKATVYNTLKLFVEKGLLREVLVDSSKVFYDSNTSEHHHFYDIVNGKLIDIPADEISISTLPKIPPGMTSAGVDVVVRIRSAV